jgi:hypothetical protein
MAKRNYAVNFSFEEIRIEYEDSDSVYLSIDELIKLHQLKLKGEPEIICDLFLVGAFSGMRYSDYSKLTEKYNIVGNNIQKKTKKTNERVVIPIHSVISSI